MANFQLTTPVAFLIFNRPDTTARVFEAIRQAKPPKLLVVADGPRPDRPDDIEKCKAARAIVEGVDWDCEVLKNYSDINLGCGKRPATGITWVFEQVEEAIILEDDCMPNPTFFEFCQAMLAEYRDDKRIMMIGGTNFLGEWKSKIQSYHFSFYGGTWGWASYK
jgi:GT2 family glycosyltransferase